MPTGAPPDRLAKGVNLIGLTKLLRIHRRTQPITGLSDHAQQVLDSRVLVSQWYPLPVLHELLDCLYVNVLDSDSARAMQIGVDGGKEIWGGAHQMFIANRPVEEALRAAVPGWRNFFNFGGLQLDFPQPRKARFTVQDYADIPICHGLTLAGWHLAIAHLCGQPLAQAKMVSTPWTGDQAQIHEIRY